MSGSDPNMGMQPETNPIFSTKQEKWYADFLDNLPAGIYRSTLEGRLVFCNRGLAEILGFHSPGEMIGYPVIELYMDKKDRGRLIRNIMDKGSIREMEVTLKKRQRTPIRCAITAAAVLDDDGMMVFIDGLVRDITHKVVGQEEKLSREKLQGVLEMAGGISHTMNQPLTIINHHVKQILSGLRAEDGNYEDMMNLYGQIRKLNDIAEKIKGIRKYETMDYVEGIRIVDIDKSSS